MAGGYLGKILWIDLDNGSISEERLSDDLYSRFIGGYGLAARLAYERQPGATDALGPDNILSFTCGPLGATAAPAASRFCVAAKSPLTATWGDASCGGFLGAELKKAGYDGVFVRGVAERPVYLCLADGEAELRDAAHLWGLDTAKTEDAIRAELGDNSVRIASIGPAGESKSLISCVIHDKGRAAGRSGLGAVMGTKRLKAVAVRGRGKVPVADPERLAQLRTAFLRNLRENPTAQALVLQRYGTAGNVAANLALGASGVRNWAMAGHDAFPEVDLINGENVIRYQRRRYACYGCPVGCGGIFSIPQGGYLVEEGHKPEYETLAGFGTLCLNSNVESIIKCNDICNRAGLDTISASTCVAFALECYENGLIGKTEADGLDLAWGNHEAIVALTQLMARREGIGAVLADGVKVAAERIGRGAERYAVHVHGQEPGFHDAKLCPSRGTAYVADPTPGRHTAGGAATAEFGRATSPHPAIRLPKVERYQYSGKGEVQATWSNYKQVVEASGLCLMASNMAYPLEQFLSAVTGRELTVDELLLTGERIQTLRHVFNVREGLKPADFVLPDRLVGRPPLENGPTAGVTIDIETLVREYYLAMGWDPETGVPGAERLARLGLADLVGDLT